MSEPAPPYPPPPPGAFPGAYPGGPSETPPTNGMAVAALVLGIVALLVSWVPFVDVVGILGALTGIGLGIAGLRRARRTGRGRGLAATGIALSGAAIVVSTIVMLLFWRYLGDLLDWVEPPDPSARIGEEFETDDGDLAITVTSVECAPDVDLGGHATCTFAFDVHNQGDRTISLGDVEVKSVVDGRWDSASLEGNTTTAPGEDLTITGDVSVWDGALDGLAFDADDASSHSAVVVDTRAAWDEGAGGK